MFVVNLRVTRFSVEGETENTERSCVGYMPNIRSLFWKGITNKQVTNTYCGLKLDAILHLYADLNSKKVSC